MTNFEEFTKDTETLAKFLSFINNGKCDDCIAQMECRRLRLLESTYRLCTRAWCSWLNKED